MKDHTPQPDTVMTERVRVLLVGEADPDEGSLHAQLDSMGHKLILAATPEEALSAVYTDRPDLVVIDVTAADVDGYHVASHIKNLTREKAVPVMFACLPGDVSSAIEGLDRGADDCFVKPIETDVLAARIRLLLRNRELELSLRRQNRETGLLNRQLMEAREEIQNELELARRIQQGLLPATFPELERFRFAATLRPSGEVSGDFYDMYRLDETHYGFYVADAIGHGVPAALLTIFVKKGIQTRDLTTDGYRLLPPGEVLDRLNRDLMAEELPGNPFVTLCYAILDVKSGTLSYASGGHPPAIVLSADGATLPLMSEGALLGVFESEFTTGEVVLTPGDRVVLYTDGIEQAHDTSGRTGLDALLDYVRAVPDGNESNEAFAARIDAAFDALFDHKPVHQHSDDVTVLVLETLT